MKVEYILVSSEVSNLHRSDLARFFFFFFGWTLGLKEVFATTALDFQYWARFGLDLAQIWLNSP